MTAASGHGVAMVCDHADEWNAPLWQQPVELFDGMFVSGVRAHYVALGLCAPLLIATPGSLVVTAPFAVPEAEQAGFGAAYAIAKSADDRLALAAAVQLRERSVASLAQHTGLVRTEGVTQFAEHLDLADSQSSEGVGRAVVALADDPDRMSLTGRTINVEQAVARYGIDVTT